MPGRVSQGTPLGTSGSRWWSAHHVECTDQRLSTCSGDHLAKCPLRLSNHRLSVGLCCPPPARVGARVVSAGAVGLLRATANGDLRLAALGPSGSQFTFPLGGRRAGGHGGRWASDRRGLGGPRTPAFGSGDGFGCVRCRGGLGDGTSPPSGGRNGGRHPPRLVVCSGGARRRWVSTPVRSCLEVPNRLPLRASGGSTLTVRRCV